MYTEHDKKQSFGQQQGLSRGNEQERTNVDVSAKGFQHDQMSGDVYRGTTEGYAQSGHRPGGAASQEGGLKKGREDRKELVDQERGAMAAQDTREAQSLQQFQGQKGTFQGQQQQEQRGGDFQGDQYQQRRDFQEGQQQQQEEEGDEDRKKTGAELLRGAEENSQDISGGQTENAAGEGLGAGWSATTAATAFPAGAAIPGEASLGEAGSDKYASAKTTRETPADMAARAAAGDAGQRKRELEAAAVEKLI